jgi:uncharacterized protein
MHALSLALFLMIAQRIDGAPPPPALVVTGSAQLLATPDEATVRLGIVRQSPNAQMAQDQASAVAQEILSAVQKVGIRPNQIQTATLVLSPVYAPRSPNSRDAPRIVAYNATNSVSIRLDNLSLVGAVIDAGLKAGANQLEGVQFGLRNQLPSQQQALKQAVEEARGKAAVMADTLRVSLVEVLEITEGNVSVVPLRDLALSSARVEYSLAGGQVETPVSPGEIAVNAQVTIRYRISPK